jgi:hypothetical protein
MRTSLAFLLITSVTPLSIGCDGTIGDKDKDNDACANCPTGGDTGAGASGGGSTQQDPNPQPDLVVTAIDWANDPATSYTVRFNATVTNQGTAQTPADVVLKLSFAVDGTLHSWSDTHTSSIAPGASVTLTVNAAAGDTPIYTPDGFAHTIVATVDDDAAIDESDESNNGFTSYLGGLPSIPSNFDIDTGLQPAWGSGDIPADASPDTVGAFRFICGPSHLGWDDPIVAPGKPGASHLHQFFGNDLTDAHSTYESLRTSGDGSCGAPVNRSAYWMPAMMTSTGKVVVPDHVSIYYKRLPKTSPDCQKTGIACVPIPRGLRYVFGYNFTTGEPNGHFNCQGPTAVSGTFPDIITAAQGCGLGNQLGAVLSAPSCWDGARLDSTDHRSHVAHGSYGDWGYYKCPDTHPFIIPTFTLGAWYTVDDDLDHSGTYTPNVTKTWYLASDHMGKTMVPGETLHSDWFGAWDDEVLKMWTDGCIDSHLNCSGGDLGNGLQIVGAQQPYPNSWISTPHQVDPPEKP